MREFEVLPTEREFNQLAMEYNKLKLRQNILSRNGTLIDFLNQNKENGENAILIPDATKKKAMVIIAYIRRLYSLSPYNLRPNIRNILSFKLNNTELVDNTHSVTMENIKGVTFCSLLNVVLELQNNLIESIALLEHNTTRLLNIELVAMHSLTLLKCYCVQ